MLSAGGCAQNAIFELEFDFSTVSDVQEAGAYSDGAGGPCETMSDCPWGMFCEEGVCGGVFNQSQYVEFNGVRVAVLAAEGVLDSLAEGGGAPGVLDFNEGSDVFRFNRGAEGNVLRLSVVSESEPAELAVVLRYCLSGDTDCTGRVEGMSADEFRREYWFVLERPLYRGRVTGFSFDMQSPGLPRPVCGGSGSSGCERFDEDRTTVPIFSASSSVSCADTPEPYCRIPQCRVACGGAGEEGLTHCRGSEDGLSPPHECDD
jgi:hypothetical protein